MAIKKKSPEETQAQAGPGQVQAPGQAQAQGMPGQMPMGMQGMPGQMPMQGMPGQMPMQGMPGQMPMQGMPNQGFNPMAMMQMMQMMMGGAMGMGMPQAMDPAAMPFSGGPAKPDGDPGLDAGIIRPALLSDRIRRQHAVRLGSVLDLLCLTEDGQHALGGIPQGCTMALAGPPGKGKTRSALAGLVNVALRGEKVAFVVAEEGFHDRSGSGRDDLCSRLCKIGMTVTGIPSEDEFSKKVLENVFVMECQYHKGTTWDDFVAKYRYLVEKEQISFAVIDSLNMLDPTRNRTADNLSALKTYNHEAGVTCLCLGQIKDGGGPVGGEALQHTADAVFLIEEMSLGSKEIAEQWGGQYRDRIDIITAVKSVTTPRFQHPIRLTQDPGTGVLIVHPAQPAKYKALPVRPQDRG